MLIRVLRAVSPDGELNMENTVETHIVSAQQRLVFMEMARDTAPNEIQRRAWDEPIQQLRLALAHFHLALELELTATVPHMCAA